MVQRCHFCLGYLPAGCGGPALADAAAVSEDFPWVGRKKGVARPTLTAFERLQQKSVWASVNFAERGHRGVAVEDDFAGDWGNAGSPPCAFGKCGKAVDHFGAPTT
jgi:hypothetical protein